MRAQQSVPDFSRKLGESYLHDQTSTAAAERV